MKSKFSLWTAIIVLLASSVGFFSATAQNQSVADKLNGHMDKLNNTQTEAVEEAATVVDEAVTEEPEPAPTQQVSEPAPVPAQSSQSQPASSAQTESEDLEVEETSSTQSTGASNRLSTNQIMYSILFVLLILAILWAFGHMIYIIFFVEKKVAHITVEEMVAKRKEENRDAESSQEDLDKCASLIDDIISNCTTSFRDEEGQPSNLPTSRAMMQGYKNDLDEYLAIAPTTQEAVNAYNDLVDAYNESQKREFCGSKPLLWICAIIAALTCFKIKELYPLTIILVFSGLMYYMSALKPLYVIFRMELNNQGVGTGCMNKILAIGFGAMATAKTYTTVTKWSDGSTTRDDDHSEHWGALILTIVICLVLVSIMTVVGLINYLKNYVFVK